MHACEWRTPRTYNAALEVAPCGSRKCWMARHDLGVAMRDGLASHHRRCVVGLAVVAYLALAPQAYAGQLDFTLFLGRAYPTYDERLTLRPSAPSLPGVDIDVAGEPVIRADGGAVLGGALAFELGVLGLEARVDGTDVGFDFSGARYDLRATQAPFTGLTGSVTLGNGRFDVRRLYLLSGNVRLRTPGPIGLVASGGLSLLPDITITGAVPVSLDLAGLSLLQGAAPRLLLRAAPGKSEHRVGVNGGAGLRVGGDRVALQVEVRGFYFREYELRFAVEGAPDFAATLLDGSAPIRFRPVIVNAQAGLVFRF